MSLQPEVFPIIRYRLKRSIVTWYWSYDFGNYYQFIDVKVGKETNIAIKRTYIYKYPAPYSKCDDLTLSKSVLYTYITHTLNQTFRQQDCLDLCFRLKLWPLEAVSFPDMHKW